MSVASLAIDREEDPAHSPCRRHPPRPGLQFDLTRLQGPEPDGEWKIEVAPDRDMITRRIWRNGERWKPCGSTWELKVFDAFTEDPSDESLYVEIVWPTWPARSQDEVTTSPTPLADVQEYWSTVGNRLRDSAKWTAAVLGAALATVIGTSPLAGMREHRPQLIAILLGSAGLVFLGITIFLVLQVMRPQSVSYTDMQEAEKGWRWLPRTALCKWKNIIESQQDLYLPWGINLDDSGCWRGLLLIVLCRFSAVVAGWRVAVLPDVLGTAPVPTAPGRPPFRSRGRGGWSGGCGQGAQPRPAGQEGVLPGPGPADLQYPGAGVAD